VVRYPDGRPFRTLAEISVERDQVAAERDQVAVERDRAVAQRDLIVAERDRIAAQRDESERRLRRLRDLTQKALAGTATDEDRAELQSLMTGP
jgi:hypothetical protein